MIEDRHGPRTHQVNDFQRIIKLNWSWGSDTSLKES